MSLFLCNSSWFAPSGAGGGVTESAYASIVSSASMESVGAEAPLTVDAADFDGTNDYAKHTGDLTGGAAGQKFTLCCFLNFDVISPPDFIIFSQAAFFGAHYDGFVFGVISPDTSELRIVAKDNLGNNILNIHTSALSIGTWYSILCSVDLSDSAKRHLYVNGSSDLTVVTYSDKNISFDKSLSWTFGAKTNTLTNIVSKYDGGVAEFWFDDDTYIDFSSAANRSKFISSTNKPVDLGSDGSLPTGTAPEVYFHLDNAETANNFVTNAGGGGSFTLTGTLATAATSPSD